MYTIFIFFFFFFYQCLYLWRRSLLLLGLLYHSHKVFAWHFRYFFHFISVITNAVVFVVVPSLMSIKAYIYFINFFFFVICLYYLLFIFYFFLYVWALCQNLEFKKKCFLSSIVCFHYICVLLRICFVQRIIWREFCWYYSSLLEKACIFISLLSKSINYEKDGVWFH